jgi:TM2 domain-containing membrane protein YozV
MLPYFLSVILPGLGQILKGHFIKGVMFMILFGIGLLLIPFFGVGLVIAPVVWVWNIIDAFKSEI